MKTEEVRSSLETTIVGGYINTKCEDNNNNTTSYIAKDLNKGEQRKGNHKTTLKNTTQNVMPLYQTFLSFLPTLFFSSYLPFVPCFVEPTPLPWTNHLNSQKE